MRPTSLEFLFQRAEFSNESENPTSSDEHIAIASVVAWW